MRTSDFAYHLPEDRIAHSPAEPRDHSKLLVWQRSTQAVDHKLFKGITDLLNPGDVLVLNDSKVVPARLRAANPVTQGTFELLLVSRGGSELEWWCLVKPGKRAKIGTVLELRTSSGETTPFQAEVLQVNEEGHRLLQFSAPPLEIANRIGEPPLPPYITPSAGGLTEAKSRYQTVYAREAGSVAAPTAGLHFTPALLQEIAQKGVTITYVTLHVGLGTFSPVKADRVEDHRMHEESYSLSEGTVEAICKAGSQGKAVWAVGTTTTRVLESVYSAYGELRPGQGRTCIFIYPPYQFKVVDRLITNFHLPESTLLMLVAAFADPGGTAGRERILQVYREAINEGYRFYSYGDAMVLI